MKTYRVAKDRRAATAGHEAVGTVIDLGAGVAGLEIGQRIGASAVVGCGECSRVRPPGSYTWCKSAKLALANARRAIRHSRALHAVALPDDLPWDEAALLTGDGMGVPWHTAKKIDRADIRNDRRHGLWDRSAWAMS